MSPSESWLDSDGRVGDNTGWQDPNAPGPDESSPAGFTPQLSPAERNPNLVNFEDGEWHHVLVSSLSGERSGYRLYVDGLRVAELSVRSNKRWQAPGADAGGPSSGSSSSGGSGGSSSSSRTQAPKPAPRVQVREGRGEQLCKL